ncbi:hypothetical protein BDR05DRAFT_441586 [Suillus weaverae]|nr:hypothetical protein BDR05DRAFT_441586 [Suillus weaverae]
MVLILAVISINRCLVFLIVLPQMFGFLRLLLTPMNCCYLAYYSSFMFLAVCFIAPSSLEGLSIKLEGGSLHVFIL